MRYKRPKCDDDDTRCTGSGSNCKKVQVQNQNYGNNGNLLFMLVASKLVLKLSNQKKVQVTDLDFVVVL